MGRRQVDTVDLRARARARGYQRGAHAAQDRVKDDRKHSDTTKKNQDSTLHRYVLWRLTEMEEDWAREGRSVPTENDARRQYLRPEVKAPDLATIKDFLRFYIATSHPLLASTPTVDSMVTIAEWFFAGFKRATGALVPADDWSETYGWLRRVLPDEGLLVNRWRPKHNFTEKDLTRILCTLFTKDDLIFIPERYRIQFAYIIRVYCWTGARIGAFFTNGLRYRDIELVLQRTPNAPWKLTYKIDQRWIKNNRDPENIVFGTVLQEHDQLIYDDTTFLLCMAFADQALFGFDTLADLQAQQIPAGDDHLVLRWRTSALDKPILRGCTKAGGLGDGPMPEKAFKEIFQSTLRNAGYLCAASVHSIRRQLGKKVDELYTEVQRSQQLTQADPRIFGQSYVANTSSVDGRGAFLGEAVEHRHIHYFQSLERFREPGLPCELPARLEEDLKQDPQLRELEAEVHRYSQEGLPTLKDAKQRLASYLRSLKRSTLHAYQEAWIQERRDWKITTRGKEQTSDRRRTDLVHHLSMLFPERLRIAQRLVCDETLTSEARWLTIEDLHLLCTRDLSVCYLPGHQPLDNCCPVAHCRTDLERLPKRALNQHIQGCARRETADIRQCSSTEVFYCHLCFSWEVGNMEWKKHCQTHLDSLGSKRCGTITYCHTLVRPAYCPFCLGDAKSPVLRLQSWCRDHALWQHVDKHLRGRQWPVSCPHPLCDVSLGDARDLRFHFIDEHGLSRTVPANLTNLKSWVTTPPDPGSEQVTNQKRKAVDNGPELAWLPQEPFSPIRPSKRARRNSLTVVPTLLSNEDAGQTQPASSVDLSPSDSSVYTPEPMSSVRTTNEHRPGNELELDSLFASRFQSCDSAAGVSLHGDDLFAQFLRPPSPDCVPPTLVTSRESQTTLDTDARLVLTGTNVSVAELHQDGSAPEQPAATSREIHTKLRIRLRVEQPRTTIKLRLPAPARTSSEKRQRQPRQSTANSGRRTKKH